MQLPEPQPAPSTFIETSETVSLPEAPDVTGIYHIDKLFSCLQV